MGVLVHVTSHVRLETLCSRLDKDYGAVESRMSLREISIIWTYEVYFRLRVDSFAAAFGSVACPFVCS